MNGRDDAIRAAARDGEPFAVIGNRHGITGERVRQIVRELAPEVMAARAEARRALREPVYCTTCGVTLGRYARRLGSTHCRKHHRGGAPQIWTREACISALRDFHDEHGRAPTVGELGAGANAARGERVDWLPWYGSLVARFGTSRAAMLAAGIPPNTAGRYARDSAVYARRAGV